MPKILALVTFRILPPDMGGQKGIALFYKYLQKHLSIELVVSRNNNATHYEAIPVLSYLFQNKQIYRNLLVIKSLRQFIRDRKIDCLICEHSYTGWIGWLLNKQLKIPFIIHSHNIESSRFRQMKYSFWRIYSLYEKWIHRKASFNFFKTSEDLDFAIRNFKLPLNNVALLPYGVESIEKIQGASSILRKELQRGEEYLFFFNGTLEYYPNRKAIEMLISEVIPLLDEQLKNYKIVITGKSCPSELSKLMADCPRIIYKGFVENIHLYYQGSDVFVNPVVNDAGVKTKLVEALANGCKVVSTYSGSKGINTPLVHEQMIIVPDNNWKSFTNAIIEQINSRQISISSDFCDYYSWETIAADAADRIKKVTRNK